MENWECILVKFSDESISGGGVRMREESRVMPVVWLEQQVSRGHGLRWGRVGEDSWEGRKTIHVGLEFPFRKQSGEAESWIWAWGA